VKQVFLIRRPSFEEIERFLHDSRDLPLSYGQAGILGTNIHSGRRDERLVPIGKGREAFASARSALMEWKHFDLGWVELFPAMAPIEVGTVVGVLIRHLGFWSLNGCRIVAVSQAEPTRFGFTYGTLPNHCEAGEERFEVFLDDMTGQVMYRIHAISWANASLARVGQPIVRVLQERFRRQSVARMRRAIIEPL
jgi:uncharacterized protein (UPF0548 family)